MSITLRPKVRDITVVPAITGEEFRCGSIPETQRKVLEHASKPGSYPAPMPLLLLNFPHVGAYLANSSDISGIAPHAIPALGLGKGDAFVATYHGGTSAYFGLLLPDKIELALDKYKKRQGGINAVGAIVLTDVYDKDPLADLLQGGFPDGHTAPVFSYAQTLAGETPKDRTDYIQVRSLTLAQKTDSRYQPLQTLTDNDGRVTDSQVIVYAGGLPEGQLFIELVKRVFSHGRKFGILHPWNSPFFDPHKSQGQLISLGYDTFQTGTSDPDNFYRTMGSFVVLPVAEQQVVHTTETVLEAGTRYLD